MTRLRTSLFLLAAFALLTSGASGLAGASAAAVPPPSNQSLAPTPATAGQCADPTGVGVAIRESALPPPDYILCSCSYCRAHPGEDCQISPSGYSILCADYYAFHCS
jgi:hypothetical protein